MENNYYSNFNELIDKIENEKKDLINNIKDFIEKNKVKDEIKSQIIMNFGDQIDDFKSKYNSTFAGIIDKEKKKLVSINDEYSEKIRELVKEFEHYINNL